jgi:hypothetical protein
MLKVVQNIDSTDSRPWIYDDDGKIVALVTNGDRDLADKFAAAPAMHEALRHALEVLDATWRMLDAMYGANHGEQIPIDILPDDRVELLDDLLGDVPDASDKVAKALAAADGREDA